MRDGEARGVVPVLDENLSGHRIAGGLRRNGIPVKLQTELMRRGITDEEVLACVAQHRGHYLLSKDGDFHRKPSVKAAVMAHGIGAFVITAHKSKTALDLVDLITRAWPRMERCAKRNKLPFVAKILADARVEVVT